MHSVAQTLVGASLGICFAAILVIGKDWYFEYLKSNDNIGSFENNETIIESNIDKFVLYFIKYTSHPVPIWLRVFLVVSGMLTLFVFRQRDVAYAKKLLKMSPMPNSVKQDNNNIGNNNCNNNDDDNNDDVDDDDSSSNFSNDNNNDEHHHFVAREPVDHKKSH